MSTPRLKRGFTMIELVVAVAMIAILASLILPAASTYLEQARVSADASTFKELGAAIKAFRAAVGNYPARLSDLTSGISSTDLTSCSTANPTIVTYGAANAAKWKNGGPYYPKAMARTGLALGIGTARDLLIRTSTNTTAGSLQIVVPGTRLTDARELNRMIDGETDDDRPDESNNQGAVQWSVPLDDFVILTYNIPVGNSC